MPNYRGTIMRDKKKVKANRFSLTNRMLERFAERNQDGVSVEEIMFDIAQNKENDPDTILRAASKLADLVYPRAQSVEIEIDDIAIMTPEQRDDKLKQLMAKYSIDDKGEDNAES